MAPVDVLFIRGRFHFGTSASAARIRHLRARPAISVAYFESDEVAVLVNGRATVVDFDHPDFRGLDEAFVSTYGGTPSTRNEKVVYVRVDPDAMHGFAKR